MNAFRKVKRVVSQFFETEYFYRWIHRTEKWIGDDGKKYSETTFNALTLADTWNGDWAIFNYLDMKLTHMLHNLRVYGNESDSYLDSSAIIAYGNDKDKEFLYNYFVNKFDKEDPYWAKTWDITKDVFDKKEIKNGAKFIVKDFHIGFYKKPGSNKPKKSLYLFKLLYNDSYERQNLWYLGYADNDHVDDSRDDMKVKTVRSTISALHNIVLIPLFEPSYKCIKEKVLDWDYEEFFFTHQTVDVEPKDYNKLSEGLRPKVRGARAKLHTLWKFRKQLRDYKNYSAELTNDPSIYDDVIDIKDSKERYITFDEKTERCIKAKQREFLYKVVDLFVENADSWYD